jgi:hypothetical protein
VIGYLRDELRVLDPNWIFGTITWMDQAVDRRRAGGQPRSFRSEFVPRKGTRVAVDVRASVLVGDGEVVGVTSIARDRTESDRLENELRQAQKMRRSAPGHRHRARLQQSDHRALGYSDELIEEAAPNTNHHSAAVEVRRAADRASALTQQLLAYQRRQTSVAQSVTSQGQRTWQDLIRRLIARDSPAVVLQPDLATISADSQQIGQS